MRGGQSVADYVTNEARTTCRGLMTPFDATIDLLGHHLDDAGIPPGRSQEALEAVREAVRGRIPGRGGWTSITRATAKPGALRRSIGDRWITLCTALVAPAKTQTLPEWTLARRGIEARIRETLARVREAQAWSS